jgi:hypothetical protein
VLLVVSLLPLDRLNNNIHNNDGDDDDDDDDDDGDGDDTITKFRWSSSLALMFNLSIVSIRSNIFWSIWTTVFDMPLEAIKIVMIMIIIIIIIIIIVLYLATLFTIITF